MLDASGGGVFLGDSLTIIAFNGQANLYNTSSSATNAMDTSAALELFGTVSGQTFNVSNLVLANGGAVIDKSRNVTSVLSGTSTWCRPGRPWTASRRPSAAASSTRTWTRTACCWSTRPCPGPASCT